MAKEVNFVAFWEATKLGIGSAIHRILKPVGGAVTSKTITDAGMGVKSICLWPVEVVWWLIVPEYTSKRLFGRD